MSIMEGHKIIKIKNTYTFGRKKKGEMCSIFHSNVKNVKKKLKKSL